MLSYASHSKQNQSAIVDELKATDRFGDIVRAVKVEPVRIADDETCCLLHFVNPFETDPVVVTVPSRASAEDIEWTLSRVVWTPEFCKMLHVLAEAYLTKTMVLFEGGTSVGKTFAVSTFTRLIYGKSAKPLDFYCSGNTDADSLMGRYTQEKDSADGPAVWKFSHGPVAKAFIGAFDPEKGVTVPEQGGPGYILHLEEVGLAKPAVIDALLKLGGEQGTMTDSIQLGEDRGQIIPRGPDTFIVMSTNDPTDYVDRNEIDPALARRTTFVSIGNGGSKALATVARKIFTYRLGNGQFDPEPGIPVLDLRKNPVLGVEIAEICAHFHLLFKQSLRGGESGRLQRFVLSNDELFKVANNVLFFQVIDPLTGRPDFVKTIIRALRRYYLDRLRPDEEEKLEQQLPATTESEEGVGMNTTPLNSRDTLEAAIREFMEGEVGKKKYGPAGKEREYTRKTILDGITQKLFEKAGGDAFSAQAVDPIRKAKADSLMARLGSLGVDTSAGRGQVQ